MHEILFRGKRLDNGGWATGVYGTLSGEEAIIIDRPYISMLGDLCSLGVFDVNPVTVGQYTGLNDKNGKRIFDGDILLTTNSNCKIWIVDYKLSAFCANQASSNYACVLDDFMDTSEVEVIGNIHDNPELLEVSGNA